MAYESSKRCQHNFLPAPQRWLKEQVLPSTFYCFQRQIYLSSILGNLTNYYPETDFRPPKKFKLQRAVESLLISFLILCDIYQHHSRPLVSSLGGFPIIGIPQS